MVYKYGSGKKIHSCMHESSAKGRCQGFSMRTGGYPMNSLRENVFRVCQSFSFMAKVLVKVRVNM